MIEILKDIGIIVGIPIGRSISGWAVNALKDSKITEFEWKQLLQTVIRVGTLGFVAYLGLSVAGVDGAAFIGSSSAFIADKLFNALKKLKK